jgi:hypothetical protein
MRPFCDKVHEFADGELSPAETEAFTAHLIDCQVCGRELENIFALKALAETAAPATAAPVTREVRVVPAVRRWRTWLWGAFAGVALAGATAVLLVHRAPSPADRPWLAANERRPIDPRLSDPRADVYGRFQQMRGAGDEAAPPASYALLDQLERRGDLHGLINRLLLDRDLAHARARLEALGADARFDNERAVVALLDDHPDQALRLTTALLARQPRTPQALWNRALALRDLHAEEAAAAAFETLAALGEPGWSEEARRRARDLRASAELRRRDWQAAEQATARLVSDGTLPPPALVTRVPDLVRARFYDAVRVAGSRAALDHLEPLARALDAQYGEPGVLAAGLERVRRLDLRRRAPLALRYAELLSAGWQPSTAVTGLVKSLREAGPAGQDLLLGVLLTGQASGDPGELDRLARAQHDPWFDAAAVELIAAQIGDERRLRDAVEAAAGHHLETARLRLGLYQAQLLLTQQRAAEAEAPVSAVLGAARFTALVGLIPAGLLSRAASYQGDDPVLQAFREEVAQATRAARP